MADIKRLGADDIPRLIELFLDCFEDDHFYAELFTDVSKRRLEMEKSFSNTLDFCVRCGGTYGIERDGKLAAFLLFFDYQSTRKQDPQRFAEIFGGSYRDGKFTLPNQEKLHNRIGILGENITYLLSVGVASDRRRKGYGGMLVDFLMENHSTDFIVSDVSNEGSLPIYESRGFTVDKLGESYFFVKRQPKNPLNEEYFGDTVKLALPDSGIAGRLGIETLSSTEITLHGYETVEQGSNRFFVKNPVASCRAVISEISYAALLEYQRFINIAHFDEGYLFRPETEYFLLYSQIKPHSRELLFNGELVDMIKSRVNEWGIVADIQVLFPVEYRSVQAIKNAGRLYDRNVAAFLRYMDFRTHYEAGVPKGFGEDREATDFKHRIKRYYLGKIQIEITQEISADSYGELGQVIGQPAYVDLVLAVDEFSRCGVLSLVSLSAPFLLSHFMDSAIRNQLLVVEDSGAVTNLYDYVEAKFALRKKGTPKMLVTIPQDRKCISANAMASLLMSETIYESEDDMGGLCDEELMAVVNSPNGMGQYDRAFVCAHTNVCIQFCPQLKATLKARMRDETVTCFYIELLMFEESAIEIANDEVMALLSCHDGVSTMRFLNKTYSIYEDYSKTVEFWDVTVNYPSSEKSLRMLREAFEIPKLISHMERNQSELHSLFETQRDIMDRSDSALLNYIMLFLTIMQGVSIIAPWLFASESAGVIDRAFGIGIITLAMVIYWTSKTIFNVGRRRHRGFPRRL